MVDPTPPRYDEAVFGDGSMAQILAYRKKQKLPEGIDGYEFILNPSNEIINYFHLMKGVDLNDEGYVIKWYPSTQVVLPEARFPTRRWIMLCDFKGNQTTLSLKHAFDSERIVDLQRENKILRASKAKAYEQMNEIASQMSIAMKKYTELVSIARKAGGRILTEEDQEEEERRRENE